MSTSRDILIQKIVGSLDIIVDQTSAISHYTGTMPQIELDIVMANIREVYEDYHKLSQLNDGFLPGNKESKPAPVPEPIPKVADAPVAEDKKEIPVKPEEEPVKKEPVKIRFAPPVIEDEVFGKNAPKIKEQEPGKTEEKTSPKPPVAKEVPLDLFGGQTIADKFKDEKQSVNEKLHQANTDKSLASKMLHNPVKDLKTAIGINDKFKFMNELFEGNLNDYNKAIETLNNFESEQEALDCLDSLYLTYKWKNDSKSYAELKNFIIRRYTTSR